MGRRTRARGSKEERIVSTDQLRAKVEAEITAILCTALEVAPEDVVPDARIMNELGADSIDLLDIRFRIERVLGLRITNEELAVAFGEAKTAQDFIEMFTVDAMVGYLIGRLEAMNG
jgi:acyl carrier protein